MAKLGDVVSIAGGIQDQKPPATEGIDKTLAEIDDLPEALELRSFLNQDGLELARKLQMVVREREKYKRRSTELEEEIRLCRATILKLRQKNKNMIRTTIRKAVEVAVESTRKRLEEVFVRACP